MVVTYLLLINKDVSFAIFMELLNCKGFSADTLFATFLAHAAILIQTVTTAPVLPDAGGLVQLFPSVPNIPIVASWRTCAFYPFQLLVTTLTFRLFYTHHAFARHPTF